MQLQPPLHVPSSHPRWLEPGGTANTPPSTRPRPDTAPRGSGPKRRSVPSRRAQHSATARGNAHHSREPAPARAGRGASATGTCARWPSGGALPAAAYGARGPDGRKGRPPVPGVPVRPAGERRGPARPHPARGRVLRYVHCASYTWLLSNDEFLLFPSKLDYE
jgi:hypothetical protein